MNFRSVLPVFLMVLLAGCAALRPAEPPPAPLPLLTRSNSQTAADFLDLFFRLESGEVLPLFTRYEHPVSVAVTGAPTAGALTELEALLQRLRREADLQIRSGGMPGTADLIVDFVPRAQMRAAVPNFACFVVPGPASFADYLASRPRQQRWAELRTRGRALLVIPADAPPQEIRDCLHEELAQALGPVNDLWHLSDSVFNDDNVHGQLTGFDMLILRLAYQPELRSGMTSAEVAERLPKLLQRLNPAGGVVGPVPARETPQAWSSLVQSVLSPGGTPATRYKAASRAVAMAQERGWQDNRLAYAHYLAGFHGLGEETEAAVEHFAAARWLYSRLPDPGLHLALTDLQMAGVFFASDVPEAVLLLAGQAAPALEAAGDRADLAVALALQAAALDRLGRGREAAALRLDSAAHAGYGFGKEAAARALPVGGARGGGRR